MKKESTRKSITKKSIIAAIIEATGIKPEYVEFSKFEGEYYWCGKAAATFKETNTYLKRLNDAPLERWVTDFEAKVKDTLQYSGFTHINDYIESIEWDDI